MCVCVVCYVDVYIHQFIHTPNTNVDIRTHIRPCTCDHIDLHLQYTPQYIRVYLGATYICVTQVDAFTQMCISLTHV